jgi:LysM repeat protein
VQYNPAASGGLSIGQILKVPYTKTTAPATANTKAGGGGGIIHVVAAKETMFSISKAYGVSVDDIRQWNNLTDNTLTIGQEIVIKKRNTAATNNTTTPPVNNRQTTTSAATNTSGTHTVEAKETLYSIANKYDITVPQLKEWNNLQSNELDIGQTIFVKQPSRSTTPMQKDTSVTTQQPVVTSRQTTTTQPVKNDVPTAKTDTPPVKNDTPPRETVKTKV